MRIKTHNVAILYTFMSRMPARDICICICMYAGKYAHTHTHTHVCCFRCFIAFKYVIYFILWLLPLALLTLFVDALLHNEEIFSRLFMSSFFSFRFVVPLSHLLALVLFLSLCLSVSFVFTTGEWFVYNNFTFEPLSLTPANYLVM